MRKRKILALIMAVVIVFTTIDLSSFSVSAENASYSEEDFTYRILNGTYCTLTGYTGEEKEIVIPSELDGYIVQQIDSNAFADNKSITKVSLPDTIESVESSVFRNCTQLEYVGLDSEVTNISSSMFSGCTSLKEITIPISVHTIDYDAFYNCTGLTSVEIPESVTGISGKAFENCANLSSVTLPSGWNTTNVSGSYTSYSPFYGCTKLTEISLPEKMTKIPNYAFSDCKSLKKIKFNSNLTEIGYGAFSGCTGLSTVEIPEGVTVINGSAFSRCTGMVSVKLPESLETINSYAFSECAGLKNITIPEKVTTINSSVFSNCTGLEEVSLPETLISIDHDAFYNCTGLTSVEIPESVTGISGKAFENCANLSSVTLPSGWNTTNVSGSYTSYSPFYGCTKLTEISLPEKMTKIPNYAFSDCKSLKKIKFNSNLTEIGYGAFSGCTGLSTVEIPEGVTVIDYSAFSGCIGLTRVDFPNSLNVIDAYSFSGCDGLVNILIPDSVTTISGYAFYNCINLKNLTLSKNWNTTYVNNSSYSRYSPFVGCKKLSTVNLPEGMAKLPDYAFANCEFIKNIYFPEGIIEIGSSAISGCVKLSTVAIPDSVLKIGDKAFYGCTLLDKLEITSLNISIDKNTFDESNSLIIYTIDKSNVVKYCMDNDINFIIIKRQDTEGIDGILNEDKCSYSIVDQSVVNNIVKLELKYNIKDYSAVTNRTLNINVPKMSEVYVNNIVLNNKITKDYTYDKSLQILSIPIDANEGKLQFSIRMTSTVAVASYASLEYVINNEKKTETIGVVSSANEMISTVVDNQISVEKFKVSGVAPTDCDVKIYVDDELKKTVNATKLGVYETELILENPKCFKSYEIKSIVTLSDGNNISSTAMTTYSNETPTLTQFVLYHGNSTINLLELNGKRPTISFNPSNPMTFAAKFKNNGNINKVYITSTKNGNVKKIEAVYDKKSDRYIASGWFDKSNKSYIPGVISINYIENNVEYDFSPDTYFKDETCISTLPDEYKDADVKLITNTDNEVSYKVTLANTEKTEYQQTIKKQTINTPADDIYAKNNGYSEIEDKTGTEYYVKHTTVNNFGSPNLSDDVKKHVVSVIKKNDTLLVELYFDDDVAKAYDYLKENVYNPINQYVGVMKTIGSAAKTEGEIEDLWFRIGADSTLTEKERESKWGLCNIAYLLNGLSCIGKVSMVAFTALGAISAPWAIAAGIVFAACDYVVQEYIKGLNGENNFEKFINAFSWLNWIVDPSGYVYEAVDDNYLEGVTTTIYYKKKESDTPIIWDASEYDQKNPLVTDEEGKYAWDVPEGLYQVKYEKEGYKTTYSDWLPVPPPQTDINIGMVSIENPKIDMVTVSENEIIIKFSQYMNTETISNDSFTIKNGGEIIKYKLEILCEKTNHDGDKLATTFKLVPYKNLMNCVNIQIKNDMSSYNGNKMSKEFTCEKQVEKKIGTFIVENSYDFNSLDDNEITVEVQPAESVKGKKMFVTLSNNYTVSLTNNDIVFDEKGMASINFNALLPGKVQFMLQVEGTLISQNVDININIPTKNNVGYIPKAPTLESLNKTTVILKNIEGYEYCVDNGEWQTNNVFESLEAGHTYRFYQRVAETEYDYASLASEALVITIDDVEETTKEDEVETTKKDEVETTTLKRNEVTSKLIQQLTTQNSTTHKIESVQTSSNINKSFTTKIKSIKKAKKSLKIAWKKIEGVTGYQIQYSISSKFKKAKKITIKKVEITSKIIKKLKAKKKYYVRIRSYLTVNGKKKYSNWSKKKSQNTK